MSVVIQFLLGLLFGIGLVIAGMADPAKVLNFLDFAAIASGGWDASLALVLAGALAVTFAGYRIVLRQPQPVLEKEFHLPHKKDLDAPLLTGAAIFGAGWGLTGLCPGPAFVSLGLAANQTVLFVAAMLAGMVLARWLALRGIRQETAAAGR